MEKIPDIIENNSIFTEKLSSVKDKVLNFAILISAIFAIPGFIGMYTRVKTIGLESLLLFQFLLMLILIALYLIRKKISFKVRFVSYLILSATLMFSFVFNVGMLGFWSSDIILISLIISIFYKKKYAFTVLAILTIFISIIGYLYFRKYLTISFDIMTYLNSSSIWITMIITFLYISIITIFTVGIQRDFFISSIKQLSVAKESVLQSEQKFKNIFNSSTNGIVISNFEGHILEVNKSLLDFMGATEDDWKNKTIRDFILPEYHATIKRRTESLALNETLPLLEVLVKNAHNKIIPVELNTMLIDYNNQKAIFSVVRDNTERKKIEQNILNTIIKTEEKERSRLAKELHDGVGPLLSATKIYAKALKNADDEEERQYTISKLNQTVNEAIISAQEIANNISPHVLRNFGLTGAIESFYLKIIKTSSTIFDFHSNLKERIDENIETTLYRILVELINNSIKYANAELITIILIKHDGTISLNYSDNGKGFNLKKTLKQNTSMGLSNIFNRIKSLDGKIKMHSEKNKGFEVDIKIALKD